MPYKKEVESVFFDISDGPLSKINEIKQIESLMNAFAKYLLQKRLKVYQFFKIISEDSKTDKITKQEFMNYLKFNTLF